MPQQSHSTVRSTCAATSRRHRHRSTHHTERRTATTLTALFTSALLAITSTISGCGGGDGDDQDDSLWGHPRTRLSLATSLDHEEITAGSTVAIHCTAALSDTGEPIAQAEASVVITHQPHTDLAANDGNTPDGAAHRASVAPIRLDAEPQGDGPASRAVFTPTHAGVYTARCHSRDDSVTDPTGATLAVIAAAPAQVTTHLQLPDGLATGGSDTAIPAGVTFTVQCQAMDRFGNPNRQAAPADLVITGNIEIETRLQQGFNVYGTTAGTDALACVYNATDASEQAATTITDPNPIAVKIIPGAPYVADATVSPRNLQPTGWVEVNCSVRDAYRNRLPGAGSTFTVRDRLDQHGWETGLVQTASGFSVASAGSYTISCVPDPLPAAHAASDSDVAPTGIARVVRVRSGLPYSLELDVNGNNCMPLGVPLPLKATVRDRWNNEIPRSRAPLDVRVQGTTSGYRHDATYGPIFEQEGTYEVTVGVLPPHDPQAVIKPQTTTLTLDNIPPVITLHSPERAATVLGDLTDSDGHATTTLVEATITDQGSPLTAVTVNGIPQAIEHGRFTFQVQAHQTNVWGVNIVEIDARDACRNTGALGASYLYSDAYYPPITAENAGTPEARVPHAMVGHMNQRLLDDGDRDSLNDIASIAEHVAKRVAHQIADGFPVEDVAPLMPSHTPNTWEACTGGIMPEITIARPADQAIVFDGPFVNALEFVDGGLRFDLGLENFTFPVRATGTFCTDEGTESLRAGATVSGRMARIKMVLALDTTSDATGAPTVGIEQLDFVTDGIRTRTDCGALKHVCNNVAFLAQDIILRDLPPVLDNLARTYVGPVLTDYVRNLVLKASVPLPEPLNMTLNVAAGVDHMLFCGPAAGTLSQPAGCATRAQGTGASGSPSPTPGYGQVGIFAQFYPEEVGEGVPEAVYGPIQSRHVALPEFSSDNHPVHGYDGGVAIADDAINQLLWALWQGGAFEQPDLTALAQSAGIPGIRQLAVSAALPPVIMPASNSQQMGFGWGDISLTVSLNTGEALGMDGFKDQDLTLTAVASGVGSGSVRIDPRDNTMHFSVGRPNVAVEIVEMPQEQFKGDLANLLEMVAEVIMPDMMQKALAGMPLPTIELKSLNQPILEELDLADGTIELHNASVARPHGMVKITGSFQ